jgi:hypothetical protein
MSFQNYPKCGLEMGNVAELCCLSEYFHVRCVSEPFTPKVTGSVFIGFQLKRDESEASSLDKESRA